MRYSSIPSGLFKRNRQKLAAELRNDSVAIIHSNDQMVRSGDQYFPYRQNGDFFYLTGIEQEMSVLFLNPGHENASKREMLFLRKPEPKLETWEGRKLDKGTAEKISGIQSIYWREEYERFIHPLILKSRQIYFNVPELEKFKPEYPLRDERMMNRMKIKYPSHKFSSLAPLMTSMRILKEVEELKMIREAVSITFSGLQRILGLVEPGMLEYEIEAELTHEFLRRGCGGHAYPPIIAAGVNACILHYIKNDQVCRDGDLLLMDFGAEYGNYAADCSRTIPVNGRFSRRQRELYDACLRVFREARRMFKPGTTINEINIQVRKLWEEEHVKLGLYSVKDLRKQSTENPLFRKYYPHGTSHFMGLDVHDVGNKQESLKPGMVLTCEPGIYIPEEGTGIRLENNLLITASGNEDLMDDFPIGPEEIEEAMNA